MKPAPRWTGCRKGANIHISTGAISTNAISAMANVLRSQKWGWSALSAIIGAVPIPGVSLMCDAAIVAAKAKEYFLLFGLNPIHFMGQGTAKEKLQNLIKVLSTSLGIRAASVLGTVVSLSAIEEGIKAMPVVGAIVGTVVGSGVSYASTCIILGQVIDFCEIEALKLINTASNNRQP